MKISKEAIEAAAEAAINEADKMGATDVSDTGAAHIARAALEAAWAVMHPVLTTPEELDALPTGSTIRDKNGQSWQKVADSYWHAALWKQGNSSANVAAHLCPAVVLYRP